MTHRILLIEDQKDLAFGLQRNLEFEGYEVSVVHDGRAGLTRGLEPGWDLIVLDWMLPGLDGIDVLARLRARGVETPVLVLTARSEQRDTVRGLRTGADDYMTKPFGLDELVARVEALLRRTGRAARSGSGTAESFVFGDVEVDGSARRVTRSGEEVALAPREYDLLVALLRAEGAARSRFELLRDVWGHRAEVETRTVDTHIGELRRKLEVDSSRPRFILTVRKHGYRLDREAE